MSSSSSPPPPRSRSRSHRPASSSASTPAANPSYRIGNDGAVESLATKWMKFFHDPSSLGPYDRATICIAFLNRLLPEELARIQYLVSDSEMSKIGGQSAYETACMAGVYQRASFARALPGTRIDRENTVPTPSSEPAATVLEVKPFRKNAKSVNRIIESKASSEDATAISVTYDRSLYPSPAMFIYPVLEFSPPESFTVEGFDLKRDPLLPLLPVLGPPRKSDRKKSSGSTRPSGSVLGKRDKDHSEIHEDASPAPPLKSRSTSNSNSVSSLHSQGYSSSPADRSIPSILLNSNNFGV